MKDKYELFQAAIGLAYGALGPIEYIQCCFCTLNNVHGHESESPFPQNGDRNANGNHSRHNCAIVILTDTDTVLRITPLSELLVVNIIQNASS